MAPRKRKVNDSVTSNDQTRKRISRADRERLICKSKLDALEQSETLTTEDRFSSSEKQCLLEAYDKYGFQVFQDMKLLHEFLPNRRESDLKGLLDRLQTHLQAVPETVDTIDGWQKLCQTLMGSFARNKKVNLDDALADSLILVAGELETQDVKEQPLSLSEGDFVNKDTNYPQLMRSFAQLLSGRFPDNMTPENARISVKLFNHISSMAESLNMESSVPSMLDGSWIAASVQESRKRQEMALKGIEELDKLAKKGPSLRDIEKSQCIEVLCLELPKIKRITEVLNPLRINKSLVCSLMDI